MKRRNRIAALLMIVLLACSFGVFAGNGDNFTGSYKISSKADFEPGKLYLQNWEITYGESKRPVQVLLKETKNGEEYLVRTNYFEVKYTNSKKGFGAVPVKTSEMVVPESLNNQVVNQDQLNMQRVISSSQVDREKALQLIADFLPDLVNDQYKNILN